MSGVGYLTPVKSYVSSGTGSGGGIASRRRRRCDDIAKRAHEMPGYTCQKHQHMMLQQIRCQQHAQPDVVPSWDAATPITPPAAFLPPGYKKSFGTGEGEIDIL